MIKQLIKLATHLDNKGLLKEADYLDAVIRKKGEDFSWSDYEDESYDRGNELVRETILPHGGGVSGRSDIGIGEWGRAEIEAEESETQRRLDKSKTELEYSLDWFTNKLMPRIRAGDLSEDNPLRAPSKPMLVFEASDWGLLSLHVKLYLNPNQEIASEEERVAVTVENTEIPFVPEWLESVISWAAGGGDGAIETLPIREAYLMLTDTASRFGIGQSSVVEASGASKVMADVIKFANYLDNKGLSKEADYLDAVIRKYSELSSDEEYAIIRERLMQALEGRSEDPGNILKKKKKKKG